MLADFFAWWGKHLLELLPWHWAAEAVDETDALLLVPVAGPAGDYRTLELYNRQQCQTSALGVFSADGKGVTALKPIRKLHPSQPLRLRLSTPELLEKHITLPIAAESALDHVIENEMDRETPFSAQEVLWSYAIETRNKAAGWIKVRLSILPHQAVAAVIALLPAELGLKTVEARTASGTVRLLSLETVYGERAAADWLRRGMLMLCAALFVANLAVPFLRQSIALARIDDAITAIRPAADTARRLRDRLAGNSSGLQAVRLEQRHSGDLVQVLAETTKILPDHTHLIEFVLADGKLSLAGRSANPGTLIPDLAKSTLFQSPSFTSPVTRIEGTPFSQFSIGAGIGTVP